MTLIEDLRTSEERLGTDAAAIAYRFEGRRGAQTYTADMVSTYVRDGGRWLLAVHQQTPA
ncbi:hypothetical protein [Microbacterium sufflavum]|uniref:DUF4440 domain-containing protein n=1 Tax=Microbacterium sufflavum TaxID=2851649 RepID=A0ABY4IG88_9MICO|nr:hypothetical protein [Microbacterium sufflavum]UPL11790.1 hypothetical protein KV394_12000 [Microbacterium sufflavum]